MIELVIISQILGSVAGTIFLFWACRYFYFLWRNKKYLNEIKKKQSRVSVLKLMLRARLRKNCNSLSKVFKGETILVEMFKEKYGELTSLDLSLAEHYQKIITTMNEIANECERFFEKKYKYAANSLAMQNKVGKKESNPKDRLAEYEHVLEFELPCLIMIREIILNQTSSRILIELYNELQESKRDQIKLPIELKVEDQEILFELIERAHDKMKNEKSVSADKDYDPITEDQKPVDSEESKSA